MLGPVFRAVSEYRKSIEEYPNIELGTDDDFGGYPADGKTAGS